MRNYAAIRHHSTLRSRIHNEMLSSTSLYFGSYYWGLFGAIWGSLPPLANDWSLNFVNVVFLSIYLVI
jgi:hypothetical protein